TLALGFVAATVGANDTQPFDSDIGNVQLETIAEGLEHPWSLAFLPDGSQLVTERAGRLRIIRGGKLEKEPIAGVPDLVAAGQGGLRSEEHTSELQSRENLVCRLLLEKKKRHDRPVPRGTD